MSRIKVLIPVLFVVFGCVKAPPDMERGKPGYRIMGVSEDPTYGYAQENPINVGIFKKSGVQPEYDYMKALRGPQGQELTYHRVGSCCPFETENSVMGTGFLDMWEITYEGLDEPAIIFLNAYEYESPMAPVGFTHSDYWFERNIL